MEEKEIIRTEDGLFEKVYKTGENGEPIYWLPQPDLETTETTIKTVKSTTPSEKPAMTTQQVPKMDEHGKQMQYEVTRPVCEQIPIEDEEGNVIGYEDGEIIGYEGTGVFHKVYTIEEVQERDKDNQPLFWKDEEEEYVVYTPQPPLEITEENEEYTEGLERAYELIPYEEPPEEPAPLTPQQQLIAQLQEKIRQQGEELEQQKETNLDLMEALVEVYELIL